MENLRMPKIATCRTIEAAQAEVAKMQATGWPLARAKNMGDYYVILTHANHCTCGRCPVLYDDGVVRQD